MSKFIILADVHLGVQGRLQDTLWALRVTREYAKRNSIKYVYVAGDLFHDRKSLDIDVLNAGYCFFKETRQEYDQEWVTSPGNHDMFLKHSWDVNSLIPMSDHLTVINDVKILKFDDVRFWVVPFIYFERAYMRVIDKISEQCQPGDNLLTHVGVRGAELNSCFLLKDWSIVDFENTPFERVYTGHFHTHQKVGKKVWYPGSLIPFKFDEGDVDHGFLVYDTEKRDHVFKNIWDLGAKYFPTESAPPQYHTFLDEFLLDKEPDDVKNCVVRIMATRDHTADEKSQTKNRLMSMGARSVRWMKFKEKAITPKADIRIGIGDMFKDWLDTDKTNIESQKLDIGLLRRLNVEIMTEGDEQYVIESDG